MRVTLLGTGGADGWPTPFCDCASCRAAATAPRFQTSALVDETLLLDLGPTVPFAAVRAGVSLRGVRGALVTHAHDDHLDPANLLYRGWCIDTPLVVAGPAPAVEQVRPWLAPGGTAVTLRALAPGEKALVAGYKVVALQANHMHWSSALLYGFTDGRSRVLLATDTGPVEDAAWAPLERLGGPMDLILLEETFGDLPNAPAEHHDLARFEATLRQLVRLGHAGPDTRVVAIHLAHHNPPPDELDARLSVIGQRVGLAVSAGCDREVIDV